MSRIGKKIIQVPDKVKVTKETDKIKIEGPAGKLEHNINAAFDYKIENNTISITSKEDFTRDKGLKAFYGMERAILNNKINGVKEAYVKTLLLSGIGYRTQLAGDTLNFTLGFSHPVKFKVPAGIKAVVEGQTKIVISGPDKGLVGLTASKIKMLKKPEPYGGKGIMYEGERIRRKAGKSAASTTTGGKK